MFDAFVREAAPDPSDSILDVGVTSDQSYDHSNYLKSWYPYKSKITAAGIDDAAFLEDLYPGLRFVRANGLALPFDDNSFDHVHSSAVLEHVGNRANQAQFLKELWRVTRRTLFVTTPNRGFPVEFHTVLPLVHWLPPTTFRAILRKTGRSFFAEEGHLNLMTHGDLARSAREAGIARANVGSVSLLGWPSNLLLRARKPD